MILNNFTCISCSSPFNRIDQYLECRSCSARHPIVDGIPLFGHKDEVEQWTRYHTDTNNMRRVASGGYSSERPSPHNAYYSRYIPDDAETVLDVGGGDGNTTSDWAERHPKANVYIIDLSLHGPKKVLRRGLPNTIPVCAPADRRFPFPNAYFDVISTVFMVEHLPPDALARFYREARRVLKPGGKLIVASDTKFYDEVVHPLGRLIMTGKYVKNDPTHINLMTPKQCEVGISAEGLNIDQRVIHWVGGRHRIIKCMYQLLPARFTEALFSTMFIITARKATYD